MNNTTEINNVLIKLETTKYKLFEIISEIEDLEEKVKKIEREERQDSDIDGIPRHNLTTVTKDDVAEKIEDDKTRSSKVIFDKIESEPDAVLILIGVDRSMVKAKSRISTATAVIFAESSILNEEFSTSARKSSSEPEIIGALPALQKAMNLN